MSKNKNILVCPLDWGLGHATRLVPVIEELIKKDVNVFIGADNRPLSFLKQRFADLKFIRYPGFTPEYPKNGSMALTMIRSYPKMMAEARKSKQLLESIITENEIDIIISDNRYELSSKNAYCVFITHQLNIHTQGLLTLAKPFISGKINSFINEFDELWIPDYELENRLSGKLSEATGVPNINSHFIGPLSRFKPLKNGIQKSSPEILVMLSGPEPQRTLLEELLVDQIQKTKYDTIFLQGKPGSNEVKTKDNIRFIPHLPDDEINQLIHNAKYIVCRPGYSTIMDLAAIGRKAIFIPTPGQTEQEYLAKYYHDKGMCISFSQRKFDLETALHKNDSFSGFPTQIANNNLSKRIDQLIRTQVL